MNLKETIRPITYLKTNAADVLSTVTKAHTRLLSPTMVKLKWLSRI
jgi:hypothetical protein